MLSSRRHSSQPPNVPVPSIRVAALLRRGPRRALLAGAALSLLLAGTAQATSGPVGAWSFDEGFGTTAGDASGLSNAGTISNGTWTTTAKHGRALQFNGSSSMVSIADAPSLDISKSYSIDAWVRPTSLGGMWRTIVLKERSANEAYSLYANTDAGHAAGLVYTDHEASVQSGSGLPLSTWTHVATTWDGTTQRLYLNGQQVASAPLSGTAAASTDPLRIGGNKVWSEWFKGQLDDVRVYDRALSASEVQYDMKTAVTASTPGAVSTASTTTSSPTTTTTSTTPTTTTTTSTPTTTTTTTTTSTTTSTPTTTTTTSTTPTTTTTTTTSTPSTTTTATYAACTQTVSSASAAQTAISSASAGAVICLADGTYGSMSFSSDKSGTVTLQAQHPGSVTVGAITTTGSNLKFTGLKFINSTLQLQPPAHLITIERNYFTGGYFAVDMASADANISDVTIRGNKMVGPFGEDAIRANRYHDANGDGYGLLVEGNELTNVVQQGGSTAPHADLLQSVWGGDHLVFRKNYAHDNRAENFFVKDQPSTVDTVTVENNLLIRNGVASANAGQPAIVNLYGPMTNLVLRRNTIWDTQGSSPVAWQGSSWGTIDWDHNVLYRSWGSGSGGTWTLSNNTWCDWTGTLPSPGTSSNQVCSPTFTATASDDYRIAGSDRGVDWRPADQVYGP